jgi:hypothetical protein
MIWASAELLYRTRIWLWFYCFADGIFFSAAAASEVSCGIWDPGWPDPLWELKHLTIAYFMFKKRNIEKPAQWAVFSPFFPMPCSPVADERRRGFIFLNYSSI